MSGSVSPLTPALRAIAQLDDPVLAGVVLRSVLWTLALFAALGWGLEHMAHGWFGLAGWLSGLFGGITAALLAWLLFLPVVSIVATLFVDRVARRVEARFYPDLPPARAAPLTSQLWDGIVLGAQILVLQLVALLLALPFFGLSVPASWLVAAWAIGRGLFVAVAMRRMPRAQALAVYRRQRVEVWIQGGLVTAAGLVPVLNLVAPVLGVAALVHVLHADRRPASGLAAIEHV